MKLRRLTRRQFFKLNALGAGALTVSSLAGIVALPSPEAQASTFEPSNLSVPQPKFSAIGSTTAFGPPTDLSAGWDGTLWAIDASGAPHMYDPARDAWQPHGDGPDAAANIGTTGYRFKGSEYVILSASNVASTPQAIGATWPQLPDSFKMRVTGAANVNGVLTLFSGGRFVPADDSAPVAKLTDLANWPQTPNWRDGVIDAVGSAADGDPGAVLLFRGSEYITLNLHTKAVTSMPATIDSYAPWRGHLPSGWASGGIDAAISYGQNNQQHAINVGPALALFASTDPGVATPQYVAAVHLQWPQTWHPVLNHAPSGRMGNLWCATTSRGIVQHDGETWHAIAGISPTVAVGQDNSVYVISGDNQTIDKLVAGTGWVATATAPGPLAQVAVGDDDHVFVLGVDSSVHRLVRNAEAYAYTPVDLGVGVPKPTHMTANTDGTLWHCNPGDPNAQRFISESTSPSVAIPVKNGVVTGVHKVASTGFGTALLLVTQSGQSQPQMYRFDSPYVFKTSTSYKVWPSSTSSFARGLGNLYFVEDVTSPAPDQLFVRFVALDLHTGREFAGYTPTTDGFQYTGMVFDPVNALVYVGTAPYNDDDDNTTPGELIALDARTLAVKWRFTTPAGIDATPALSDTLLCFGDRTAVVYCIDTKQALIALSQNKPIPTRWTFPIDTNGPTHRVSTPLFAGDQVIATMWDVDYDPTEALLQTVSIAVSDGSGSPFGLNLPSANVPRSEVDFFFILQPPILGYASFPGFTEPSHALFVRAVTKVIAYNLDNNEINQDIEFALPGGVITSGLIYDDGSRLGPGLSSNGAPPSNTRLWFGDDQGNLWSLDNQLRPADSTPFPVRQNTQIFATPVLYKDPQGGLTVLFGAVDPSGALPPSLHGYDPDNGNHASLPTGVTFISSLSPEVANGVIYAGGTGRSVTGGNPVQVFGIRVDALPQALRDFVIESQMMQDPDQNASGGDPSNSVPPSIARYQTHLTVVDDLRKPQIHEPVKIWCDTANTKITVDSQSFTVGPGDSSFAAVMTGADGSLVITIDATDYFAPTLRVWAGFMDPHERIVINADAEFHQRVMTAHANANDDDPDRVNLQTASNYSGQPLFTDDEKRQDPSAPMNVANSIQRMNTGLGLSSGNSKGMHRRFMCAMGVKHKGQRISVRLVDGMPTSAPAIAEGDLADPPEKYLAYADLPGATHFPNNIPSTRLASIAQPVGLSFARPDGDVNSPPTFTPLSHSDASAAIDKLQGEPWKPSDPHGGGASPAAPIHALTIFQDFWNWLKGLLDKVLQCILSVAEDILAGIQYVVNGVLKVFKAIIKVLDDVFPFLGTFFKMVEKLIDDVLAALSTLFHFDEIIKTHTFLRGELLGRLEQIKSTVKSQIVPAVDGFFKLGEAAITDFFNQLRGQLSPNQPISGMQGMGSTAHSAFTVKSPTGTRSSQAVQSSWAAQKLKTGLGSTTGETSATNGRPASVADDPVADFIAAFVKRITEDGDLSSAFGQLQSDIGRLFNPKSATQFFSTLLAAVLDILETLLIGILAVGSALADGLLAVMGDAIDALFDSQNGLMVAPLDIPVLSWLYQFLFGEPLTFVNVALLVTAIPVTVTYRVAFGRYPSQDLPAAAAVGMDGTSGPQHPADTAKVIGIVLGLFGGIANMIGGIVSSLAELDKKAPPIIAKVSTAIGSLLAASSFPVSDISKPDAYDLGEFGLGLAGLGLSLFGLKEFEEEIQSLMDTLLPFLNSALNIALLVMYCVQAGKEGISSGWQFAAGVLSTFPSILNPLKLINSIGGVILGVVYGVTGFAVGALDLVAALIAINAPEPRPNRLHLPFVSYSPQPVAALP
jgi:hypothetical protein